MCESTHTWIGGFAHVRCSFSMRRIAFASWPDCPLARSTAIERAATTAAASPLLSSLLPRISASPISPMRIARSPLYSGCHLDKIAYSSNV